MTKLIYLAIVFVVLAVAMGTSSVLTSLARSSGHEAIKTVDQVASYVKRGFNKLSGQSKQEKGPEKFTSIFSSLEGAVVKLPKASREGAGGAIARVGNELLVLTFDGQVYAVDSNQVVTKSSIAAPNNGFDDFLLAIEKPEYKEFRNIPGKIRYHDILFHEGPLGARLFVSYLKWHAGQDCYTGTVSQLRFNATPSNASEIKILATEWEELFRTSPCLPLRAVKASIQGEEAGGRLAMAPDGKHLFMSIGDYGWNGFHSDGRHALSDVALAQHREADHGKVVEIDLAAGTSRHFSIGHRNPQGITFDKTGRLWTVEHGPRGGDELNLIVDGNNYGWPLETLGTDYNGLHIPGAQNIGRHDGFPQPVWAWLPSVAVSSIMSIEGFHPAWDGDFLIGTLNGRKLIRVRTVDGKAIFAEEIEVGRRIRDLVQLNNDVIALWTDWQEVIFLRTAQGREGEKFVEKFIETSAAPPEVLTALRDSISECMQCHSFERNEHRIGPSLAMVGNAPIGRSQFADYSAAFKQSSGIWTRDRLLAFLLDPQKEMPGTSMPPIQYTDPRVPELLTDLLIGLNSEEAK